MTSRMSAAVSPSHLRSRCDMTTAGGGWTLLLSQTELDFISGDPWSFEASKNPEAPDPMGDYVRPWNRWYTGASELLVKKNDEADGAVVAGLSGW